MGNKHRIGCVCATCIPVEFKHRESESTLNGGLSDVSLAEALHCAGLDAHHNYKKMGFFSDEWNVFRLQIAKFLLSEFDITRKDR